MTSPLLTDNAKNNSDYDFDFLKSENTALNQHRQSFQRKRAKTTQPTDYKEVLDKMSQESDIHEKIFKMFTTLRSPINDDITPE